MLERKLSGDTEQGSYRSRGLERAALGGEFSGDTAAAEVGGYRSKCFEVLRGKIICILQATTKQ